MDTLAINAAEVPNMQSKIEDYLTNIQENIKIISSYQINASDGVYGEQSKTIDEYIVKTCEEIDSIVLYFKDFKIALDLVLAAYMEKDKSIDPGTVQEAKANDSDLITVNRMN